MKIPFLRTDPEAALAVTESKISDLERARADALLTDNYAGAVDTIDVQLDAHRRAIVVHRDRIAATVRQQHVDECARLERQKVDRLADTRKRLAILQSAAKQVDEATATLQNAISNLDRADAAIFGDLPVRNYLSTRSLAALADRAAGPRDEPGVNEARRVVGPLRRIARGAPYGLAEEVEDRGRRLIELMQDEPIPEPAAFDDDAEVAA
jgi:hypothetical protein